VIGRSSRDDERQAFAGRVAAVAVAATLAALLAALLVGCGPTTAPSPTLSTAPPTGSLAPVATAERSPGAGSDAPSGSPGVGVRVDPSLLDYVATAVDGVPLTFDPETSASIAGDPSVAVDATSLAVALAIVPGASAADDLAIVSVVKLRDPARDETWFRDWRDTYDAGACSQAGGLVGNAEAELGGGPVFIGSCAGGVRTYHTRLVTAGVVISITALGERRLGEKVMAALQRDAGG
jgi:hypothetical protein